jgi:hypothetical protein
MTVTAAQCDNPYCENGYVLCPQDGCSGGYLLQEVDGEVGEDPCPQQCAAGWIPCAWCE